MTARSLGRSDLSVFPIGLGCMSLSGAYGKSDDDNAIRVIHHAIDRGVTFLDSSDMYGWGHNESLIGKALAGGRLDKVVLATKFGQTQQPGFIGHLHVLAAHVLFQVWAELGVAQASHWRLHKGVACSGEALDARGQIHFDRKVQRHKR